MTPVAARRTIFQSVSPRRRDDTLLQLDEQYSEPAAVAYHRHSTVDAMPG
jgi:hypothetical protein